MSEVAIDAIDRAIVDHLQGGFPLCEQPYAAVAHTLGISEADLLARLQALLAARVLTRFGPLFQIERIGGAFVLAAMRVPEGDWQRVVDAVNAFPAVAHNYRRESERGCELNMWFVLATESADAIAEVVGKIETACGLPVFLFPKEREYFIEMKLAVRA